MGLRHGNSAHIHTQHSGQISVESNGADICGKQRGGHLWKTLGRTSVKNDGADTRGKQWSRRKISPRQDGNPSKAEAVKALEQH